MKTPEVNKKDLVFAWLNKQIKANKTESIRLFDDQIRRSRSSKEIQIYRGVKLISEITDIPYVEEDWEGNKCCNTNHNIVYLMYKGYKVFELTDKEEKNDEKRK